MEAPLLDIVPSALSIAELSYCLGRQRPPASGVFIRNATCNTTALWIGAADLCLYIGRCYSPDEQSEYWFYMRELAQALLEWRMYSTCPFDARIITSASSMAPASTTAPCSDVPIIDVHIMIEHSVLPRRREYTDAIMGACMPPPAAHNSAFGIGKLSVCMPSGSTAPDADAFSAVAMELHQTMVPLMVHWLLHAQTHDDIRPCIVNMYIPSNAADAHEALFMRLYVYRRTLSEDRSKRRKLSASGFHDAVCISTTPCAMIETLMYQRLQATATRIAST